MHTPRDRTRIVSAALIVAVALAGCSTPQAVPTVPAADPTPGKGAEMKVTSPAYADGGTMPARFATKQVAGGGNVSVPLGWSDAPAGTRSFAVAMIDTHPVAQGWVHWLAVDIPAGTASLAEGASGTSMPAGAVELATTWGTAGYGGPQPPRGTGLHDYVTTVYALDVAGLGLVASATWPDVEAAMNGHVLARASVTGRFGQ